MNLKNVSDYRSYYMNLNNSKYKTFKSISDYSASCYDLISASFEIKPIFSNNTNRKETFTDYQKRYEISFIDFRAIESQYNKYYFHILDFSFINDIVNNIYYDSNYIKIHINEE